MIIEHVPKQNFNCSLTVLKIIRKVGLHGESLGSTTGSQFQSHCQKVFFIYLSF